jgi:hypothetical protein
MLRSRAFAVAPRAFSTSFIVRKSATEAVKDTVKGVDRAVSDKIVDGIEVGRMLPLFSSYLFFSTSKDLPTTSKTPFSYTFFIFPLREESF